MLYARGDLQSITIPAPTPDSIVGGYVVQGSPGGCGQSHSRDGAQIWRLDCPPCEAFLMGSGRTRINYVRGNLDKGIPSSMNREPCLDPCWSTTPENIPMSPNEANLRKFRAEKGAVQLQLLQARAAIANGDLTPEALGYLADELPEKFGKVVCSNGHDNQPGNKYCGHCGVTI